NGRTGEATRFITSKSRWEVLLDGEAGSPPLGLRRGSLEPLWDYDGVQCAICLRDLSSQSDCEQLPCSHRFHCDCIREMRDCGAVE
ncbi:unnamed protein product, partial [Polarella glacialis]